MVTTLQEVQFSFLASGPAFRLQLPGDFDRVPDLSSPLLNGHGGRSFDFVPKSRDPGISDSILVRTLTDKDGRIVDLYQRDEPPPLWWLRWNLANGALYTHLREEDGPEMADVTVASLGMVESGQGGVPFLLPESPLEFVASSAPGYQELATFRSEQRGDRWGVLLQRPGFMRMGKIVLSPADLGLGSVPILLAGGAAEGVDVRVWAADLGGAKQAISMVLNSFSYT